MLNETILLEQNKRLREECDELRETVRQYREREAQASVLPEDLPQLTRLEEKTLTAIWSRRGVVDKATIYSAIYGDDSTVDMRIVDVAVHKLRKKLTAGNHPKIITVWGKGYTIERGLPSGAALSGEVAQMIADIAA